MKKIVLDQEEKEIEADFENYQPASKAFRSRIEKIATSSRKTRAISLRMNESDLNLLKEKAEKNGLPYQTMINVVVHKYVTDSYLDKDEINRYLKLRSVA